MTAPSAQTTACDTSDVAQILGATATLMESFHQSDLAMQDALSTLAAHARVAPDMVDLQHADLLTQTHADLAKLLGALSQLLGGDAITLTDLRGTLTLHSLQDALLEPHAETDAIEHGELSLF